MPVKVFFCYAHEDEMYLDQLKMHLKPLERQGLIELWYDRNISAGTGWEREISQRLNMAQVILLLISPDFLSSEYCYGTELRQALERHEQGKAYVIPVIVRPVYWQGVLGQLQALPKDALPVTSGNWHSLDEALSSVVEDIGKTIQSLPLSTEKEGKNFAQTKSASERQKRLVKIPLAKKGISRRHVVASLTGLTVVGGGVTYLVLQRGSHMNNWTLSGNADTNPPNDFLGTTDSRPLVIKTNSRAAIWVDQAGKVGIGTLPPTRYRLEVSPDDQLGLRVLGPHSGVGAGILLESTGEGGIPWEILATGQGSAQGEGKFNIRNIQRISDDFTITGNGNVGIGTTDPHAKLHVEGDLFVNGSISKTGGGEFVRQRNPVDPTQHIVYATPIGNEVGTYIRGTGKLVKGEALIELPEHFGLVTSEDGLTIQLTPRGEWLQLYVVHLDIRQFFVREAQNKSGQFDYLVQGVRKGYDSSRVIQDE